MPTMALPSGPHPQLPLNASPRPVQIPFAERWADSYCVPIKASNTAIPPQPNQFLEAEDDECCDFPSQEAETATTPPTSGDDVIPGHEDAQQDLEVEEDEGGCDDQVEVRPSQKVVFADVAPECHDSYLHAEGGSGDRSFNTLLLELAAEHKRALARLRCQLTLGASGDEAAVSLPNPCESETPSSASGPSDSDYSAPRPSEVLARVSTRILVPRTPEMALAPKWTEGSYDPNLHQTSSATPGGEPPPHRHSKTSQQRRTSHSYRKQRLRGLALRHLKATETVVQRMVNNNTFELVCCLVIIFNVITMALEFQYMGCDGGYLIKHPDCLQPAHVMWPWADFVFSTLAASFMVFFLIEFALRALADRLRELIFDGWLWFDLVMLGCGITDLIERFSDVQVVATILQGMNPTMLRTARVLRMLRMMKVLKPGVLRIFRHPTQGHQSSPVFPSLFLLVKSIQASREALCWSVLLLIFTMSCTGMLMHQLLLSYLQDPSATEEDRREVFEYFGTYTRTLTTMFELTLGNWAPASRLLMQRHSQYWGLFIMFYRCISCFALVNVVNAVFITETNRIAASDDEVMMMRRERARRASSAMLGEIFQELDESGDGFVTWEEFSVLLTDDVMKDYLGTMELACKDMEELFHLLDNGEGQVQSTSFIDGLQGMRGQAQNIDMLSTLKSVRELHAKVDSMGKTIADRL